MKNRSHAKPSSLIKANSRHNKSHNGIRAVDIQLRQLSQFILLSCNNSERYVVLGMIYRIALNKTPSFINWWAFLTKEWRIFICVDFVGTLTPLNYHFSLCCNPFCTSNKSLKISKLLDTPKAHLVILNTFRYCVNQE